MDKIKLTKKQIEELKEKHKEYELERATEILDRYTEILAKYGGDDIYYMTLGYESLWKDEQKRNMKLSIQANESYIRTMLATEGLTNLEYKNKLIEMAKAKIRDLPLDKRKRIVMEGLKYDRMYTRELQLSRKLRDMIEAKEKTKKKKTTKKKPQKKKTKK